MKAVRRGRTESASGANISEAAAVLRIYKKIIKSGMKLNDNSNHNDI
jgi:hypothetical protein